MKLFRFFPPLLLLFFSCSINAEIIEVKSVAHIQEQVDKHVNDGGCWVVWDLDQTVMHPANKESFGGDLWFAARVKKFTDQGVDYVEAVSKVLPEYFAIQMTLAMKPVEDDIVTLIESLQKKNVVVMGLTARSGPLVERTIEQLKAINISFTKTSPTYKPPLNFDHLKFSARHHEGVLFADNNRKGDVLKAFIAAVDQKPKKIIFIDDREKHVACVEAAAKELGIECIGLRYGHLDEAIKTYVLPPEPKELILAHTTC